MQFFLDAAAMPEDVQTAEAAGVLLVVSSEYCLTLHHHVTCQSALQAVAGDY